jgi:hypothetical protein
MPKKKRAKKASQKTNQKIKRNLSQVQKVKKEQKPDNLQIEPDSVNLEPDLNDKEHFDADNTEILEQNPAKADILPKKALNIKEGSKMFKLIAMIKESDCGVNLKQLCELSNWQPHTVRSALSRLNKVYDVKIISKKLPDNSRIYQII